MLGGYEYLEYGSLLLKQYRPAGTAPLARQLADALADLTQPYLLRVLADEMPVAGQAAAAGADGAAADGALAAVAAGSERRAAALAKLRRWLWAETAAAADSRAAAEVG